jgi:ATP-dependent HslUV protease, peptidase subunit HslV
MKIRSTTILLVNRDGKTAMAGDGQVTLGATVMKNADAFSLLAKFEIKLEQFNGQLERAAIELSKDWRTDKMLRHLEAMMIVADDKQSFLLSGTGDVIASDDGLLAIGSGSMYALAAARALLKHTTMSAKEIAEESLNIAGEICIYTNKNIVIEEI